MLKQQGHLYGLNALDFSNDGQLIATAGEVHSIFLYIFTGILHIVIIFLHDRTPK